jgi:hypothetical protein
MPTVKHHRLQAMVGLDLMLPFPFQLVFETQTGPILLFQDCIIDHL